HRYSLVIYHVAARCVTLALSLHDALPISSVFGLELKRAAARERCRVDWAAWGGVVHHNQDDIAALAAARCRPDCGGQRRPRPPRDRKSTRLNSSHQIISYAVFCLQKKRQK